MKLDSERQSRQCFLGPKAAPAFAGVRLGFAGLGGGGSHVVQQTAHLGFTRFSLFDPDCVELSNLNRLVGGTIDDANNSRSKVSVAQRVIRGLCPEAEIGAYEERWQDCMEALAGCDLVFGCLDGFAERGELEAFCRRHLIPLIDIGLTVHTAEEQPPQMSGQVILSIPGGPCMRCMQFLNERDLAIEAGNYGDAGPRPQVVFANGLLASHAVGIAVDVLTGWTGLALDPIYDSFEGNRGRLDEHKRRKYTPKTCLHYPLEDIGPARLQEL